MSIDISAFMDSVLGTASDFFNALIPIVGIIIGITLGIGLVFLLKNLIANALPRG
jgi:hypothetical protein